ncbi:hypothetical protein I545_6654 [Mycobacterium kansasii 662]|uniref:Uncharacterized protein n=1 Tax=Mycobacterium kansasii 662 TaxID=1299326 RepID=X7Y5V0_MYCKA|nr:hypothetical protein I545_6654 [Mycobacterium kansasii 662]
MLMILWGTSQLAKIRVHDRYRSALRFCDHRGGFPHSWMQSMAISSTQRPRRLRCSSRWWASHR